MVDEFIVWLHPRHGPACKLGCVDGSGMCTGGLVSAQQEGPGKCTAGGVWSGMRLRFQTVSKDPSSGWQCAKEANSVKISCVIREGVTICSFLPGTGFAQWLTHPAMDSWCHVPSIELRQRHQMYEHHAPSYESILSFLSMRLLSWEFSVLEASVRLYNDVTAMMSLEKSVQRAHSRSPRCQYRSCGVLYTPWATRLWFQDRDRGGVMGSGVMSSLGRVLVCSSWRIFCLKRALSSRSRML